MREWFLVNGWTLNMNTTNIFKSSSKQYHDKTLLMNYESNSVKEHADTKFLGLILDKHINWMNHIYKYLPKLSSACFVVRCMYSYINMFALKIIYFACVYATMQCDIFLGNSINNRNVFLQLKRIIRIITGSSSRTPCKYLFQRLELLTLSLQYILFLMRFLSQNLNIYTLHSIIHGFKTRNQLQLHKLSTNLAINQTGANSDRIKVSSK
jgi:hypothetical protein